MSISLLALPITSFLMNCIYYILFYNSVYNFYFVHAHSCLLSNQTLYFRDSTRIRNDFWSIDLVLKFNLNRGFCSKEFCYGSARQSNYFADSVSSTSVRTLRMCIAGNRQKVNVLSLKICLQRMLSSPLSNHQRSVETWRTVSLGKSKGNAFMPIFSYQRLACLFVGSFHRRVHRHFGRYQTQGLSNWLSWLKVSRLYLDDTCYISALSVAVTYSRRSFIRVS